MGFRGAAEGFRGTATWGFEGQQHGTWRHSNKWDGTSRGSRGTSRHSNMGQGYRGDISKFQNSENTFQYKLPINRYLVLFPQKSLQPMLEAKMISAS